LDAAGTGRLTIRAEDQEQVTPGENTDDEASCRCATWSLLAGPFRGILSMRA